MQRQIVGFLKTHPWCTDSIFHDPVNLMPTWTFLRSGHLLKVARGSLTPETLNSAEKPWFEEIHRNQGQPASDVQLLTRNIPVWNRRHLINKHEQHWCIPRKKRQHPLRTSFWLNWVHMFIVHASFLRGRWSQQDMQTTPRLNTYIFRVLIFYFLCSGLVAMCPQQTPFAPTVGGCWAASTQIIAPRFAAKSSKKLVGVDLPCLFVIQNPEKHFQILQRQVADKQNLGPKTCQDPFGSAGVHAPCLKQWAPKKSVFRSLKGIRSKRSRSRTRPSPQVLAPTWWSLVSDGPRSNIFELQEPPLPLLPPINRFRKAAKPPINNNVLASFAGNREITGRCPWWQLLSLFSISSRAPPTTVPEGKQSFSCGHARI